MQTRRLFLQSLAASTLVAKEGKPLAGIFPIVQTPFTNDGKLDTGILAKEIRFLDRTGVQGVVWPQLASEYFDLTMEERFAGMEVVSGVGKALKPAVVLGVQAADIETALKYVKHAEKLAPDALIALPPKEKDHGKILEYYKAIGDNCNRPLFAQTIGDMSVEFVERMCTTVPHLHFIKDEAGEFLPRMTEFRKRNSSQIKGVFSGNHGKTLIDELARGSAGTMPAVPFADLYVRVWEAWQSGRKTEALESFSKVMLLVTQVTTYGVPSLKYLLELRGVFTNHQCRKSTKTTMFDEEAKKALKATFDFVRPLLKA